MKRSEHLSAIASVRSFRSARADQPILAGNVYSPVVSRKRAFGSSKSITAAGINTKITGAI